MCDSTLQVPAALLDRKILILSEVKDILREITYKPHYLFQFQYIYARETMRLSLSVPFQPDAVREGGEISLTFTLEYSIREFERFEVLMEVLQQFFLSYERHEMDEWLKYQGKCIRDPHPTEE